ncbi:MAG: hypothetical protein O0X93_07360 [Methanocorpusculum sp.]|nr:hypothetical protein [Methanocorpusculum sp.]MDE2522957.1 hypothetical protein [Methanocorpusculum sp.]MDE2525431.1 hypothetical protein [Methanocorpusculum sp.]
MLFQLGICKGFGENGNDDYAFAYAFNQGGASTVTGYNGEVNSWYDHAMIKKIADLLVNGYNIQTAISQAKFDHGDTDAEKYPGSGAYILLYGYTGWQL